MIERIIVICILWILTCLVFPNFGDAILRALSARDQANARIRADEKVMQTLGAGRTDAQTGAASATQAGQVYGSTQGAINSGTTSGNSPVAKWTGIADRLRD